MWYLYMTYWGFTRLRPRDHEIKLRLGFINTFHWCNLSTTEPTIENFLNVPLPIFKNIERNSPKILTPLKRKDKLWLSDVKHQFFFGFLQGIQFMCFTVSSSISYNLHVKFSYLPLVFNFWSYTHFEIFWASSILVFNQFCFW